MHLVPLQYRIDAVSSTYSFPDFLARDATHIRLVIQRRSFLRCILAVDEMFQGRLSLIEVRA